MRNDTDQRTAANKGGNKGNLKKEDSRNNKFCITRIRHTKWNRKRSGKWPKKGWEEREKKMLGVGKNGW